MSSGEDDGPGGRGRAAELQGEAAEVRGATGEPVPGGCKRMGRAWRGPGWAWLRERLRRGWVSVPGQSFP